MGKNKPTFLEALGAALWAILAIVISILVITGTVALWRTEYRLGAVLLVISAALVLIFFRNRKTAVLMIGLIWVAINSGVNAFVRPTILGLILCAGCWAGIVILGRWMANNR
jgi:hypothetical protein